MITKLEKVEYIKVSDLQQLLNECKDMINKDYPLKTKMDEHIILLGIVTMIENAIK